ncbi:MAG: tyrosine--tRNA ligase [Patescibacteria group bacterium]|nr:tyrosine--tRNA ligase [Patescibacteria group bacterium]
MGLFSRTSTVNTDEKLIDELLTRGVAEVVGKDELRRKLVSGQRLRVKLGIDPTSPNLHLGRSVPLLKMQDFQKLGHHVVLIVGDFTGVIGDTSDKDSERPMLQKDTIEKNKKNYFEQIGKLIDIQTAELRYNSEWLEPLTYREIGEHADQFSVSDFIARDNVRRRLDEGKRVSLREVLYPLMQGYDSVAVKADVELGGVDQRFNLLAGRTLQEHFGQPPQQVVMTTFPIEGPDGRKMSSSWGNTINFNDSPETMYGRIMSIRDELVEKYFTLLTRVSVPEVQEILRGHPRDAKKRLAKEIVTLYHGPDAAEKAAAGFMKPDDAPTIEVARGKKVRDLALPLGVSISELRRLVEQGAVEVVDGGKIMSIDSELQNSTLKVGKHRFVKIVTK